MGKADSFTRQIKRIEGTKMSLKFRKHEKSNDQKNKSQTCDIEDCSEPIFQSISVSNYEKALLKIGLDVKKERILVCKKHHKQIRKASKKDREIERIRRGF